MWGQKLVRLLILGVVFGLTTMYLAACASIGVEPDQSHLAQLQHSPNFDKDRAQFVNINQALVDERMNRDRDWGFIWDRIINRYEGSPETALPQITPDFQDFMQGDQALKVVWFGHSSFMLNMDGKVVLVDPVFGAAAPMDFMARRFQDAVVTPDTLPEVDYIVISHDHYDHLEMDTIKFYSDKSVTFVVPLGVSSHLISWGVDAANIVEKDWWASADFDGIRFVAAPSQHFSGRSGVGRNQTLWASWVIQTDNHNVYFSGDTGYHEEFKKIGERYGPFDLAFIETGQYHEQWKETHLFPEDGIKAFQELKAERYFPVHWGMFKLSPHAWDTPIREISELAAKHNVPLVTPKISAITNLNEPQQYASWWEFSSTKG